MSRLKDGVNDLKTKSPVVARQWDYKKDFPLIPENVCNSSTRTVWWVCEKGHSWQAKIDSRTSGKSCCPICTNQRVIPGYNDFKSQYPNLLSSWDYTQNTVDPASVSIGYSKSIWWLCPLGHSWKTNIPNRIKQGGCPYCRGRKVLKGFNDLATKMPWLEKEWDYSKNTLDPHEIGIGSTKAAWWKCKNGHSWSASVSSRSKGSGCPICSNHKVLPGYNDLASQHPELLAEWDFSRNDKTPVSVTAGSEYYAWWVCKKGHHWKTTIASRTRGYGCPVCAKEYKTSFPEQTVYYYCQKYFPDTVNGYSPDWLGKSEIDVFIDSLHIGIEYDGRAWHKSSEKDTLKNKICNEHGIRIIRIREPKLPQLGKDDIKLLSLSEESLSRGIQYLLLQIGISSPDINIARDKNAIYQLMAFNEKKHSLAINFPEISAEWDNERNGLYLSPEVVDCNSKIKAWWKCPKGHQYETRIEHRTRLHSGCPYCSGKRVLPGFNDLKSQHPDIACEWNTEKNQFLPTAYSSSSNKKVWWRCSAGHEWQASISSRVKGSGCPYCAGKKAIPGVNDLNTVAPELTAEWSYALNENFTPDKVLPQSHEIVWWQCPAGHTWQEMVRKRYLSKNRLCPICQKQKVR